MATIMLLCVIHGESTPFPVRIDKTLLVGDLKDEIKKKKENDFRNIDADKLTLWNVDILYDEDVIKQLVLVESAVIKKMSPVRKISRYFENPPKEEHIHVVIERPPEVTQADPMEHLRQFIVDAPNLAISETTTFDSTSLKFMDREEQIKALMENMNNWHEVIKDVKNITEPKKKLYLSTVAGAPGVGKTTFAKRAYEKRDVYSGLLNEEVMEAVDDCCFAGRIFRIACDAFPLSELHGGNIRWFFARLLLYEALKGRLSIGYTEFCRQLRTVIPLADILDTILKYYPCQTSGMPLFIINIDETNTLLTPSHGVFLQEIIKAVLDVNTMDQRLVFPVLSGTHAVDLFSSLNISGTRFKDTPLTLFTVKQAEEIIMDLANRGLEENSSERIKYLSPYLTHLIELLGVVGRFLEVLIIEMAVLGWAALNGNPTVDSTKFRIEGLRWFLRTQQDSPTGCQALLDGTKSSINSNYCNYKEAFKCNTDIIPDLVIYSLFGWEVTRKTVLGKRRRDEENQEYTVGDAEKNGLVYVVNATNAANDNKKKLKLPALTFHQISHLLSPTNFPNFKLIGSLDHVLSPDQNESYALQILVLRLFGIYRRLFRDGITPTNGLYSCQLSDLIPVLRDGQPNPRIGFPAKFALNSAPYLINKKSWNDFDDRNNNFRSLSDTIAIHNLQNASFADGILLTTPLIFIQSKQQVTSRQRQIQGYSGNILEKGLVKNEHKKVTDANVGEHIFVLETDAHATADETYLDNEVVVTSDNRERFFGETLSQIKLFSIGRV